MVFEINQVRTSFDMVWLAGSGENALATAISSFEIGRFQIQVDYEDEYKQRLYFNPKEGKSLEEKASFKLFEGEQMVGTIIGKNKMVKGFLQSYPYRIMQLQGEAYYLYEVGFGSKGLFLCVYRNEQLIAIIDKPLKVVDYKDNYKVYCLEREDIKRIFPLVLHYDMTAHGDMSEISMKSIKYKKVNTIQKELIAKYDPNFIPMIKQMDGITE